MSSQRLSEHRVVVARRELRVVAPRGQKRSYSSCGVIILDIHQRIFETLFMLYCFGESHLILYVMSFSSGLFQAEVILVTTCETLRYLNISLRTTIATFTKVMIVWCNCAGRKRVDFQSFIWGSLCVFLFGDSRLMVFVCTWWASASECASVLFPIPSRQRPLRFWPFALTPRTQCQSSGACFAIIGFLYSFKICPEKRAKRSNPKNLTRNHFFTRNSK